MLCPHDSMILCMYCDIVYELEAFLVKGRDRTRSDAIGRKRIRTDTNGHERTGLS